MKKFMLELDQDQIEFLLRFHGSGSTNGWSDAIDRFMQSDEKEKDRENMKDYMREIAGNSETNSCNLYKKIHDCYFAQYTKSRDDWVDDVTKNKTNLSYREWSENSSTDVQTQFGKIIYNGQ